MERFRVLVLGPDCNPEEVSIPYVTYSHAAALAELHDVTLVARSRVEQPLQKAGAPFRAIEVIPTPFLDKIFDWGFRKIFKGSYDGQALTAFRYPFSLAFEWYAWRALRHRIFSGEFDVVLRLIPMSPVLPSPFAYFLRNGPIPFVVGPLNGGLPWPAGFTQLQDQREWISILRNVYRYFPFARSTYRNAAAIIAASSQTYSEFEAYGHKLFFVPEPGISRALCCSEPRRSEPNATLELLFVGGLVPRKACDLALRAAAPLLLAERARFSVVGDGPERSRLEELVKSLGIAERVTFYGWLSHSEVLSRFRTSDVFVFPTLRDNGAGVVFESLASGTVPVVVDFGGPGDIVNAKVGYKVPLTNEEDMVSQMTKALKELASDSDLLNRLRRNGIFYAQECLTWSEKAKRTSSVLAWAVGRGPKPDLRSPKALSAEQSSRDW